MSMPSQPTIGVAFITHCAKHHLHRCLPPLLNSPLKPRVVVVNSSSNDGTVEEAKSLGAETLVIPRGDFNHGTTREKARKYLGTDIVVMMTPDAYAVDNSMLEKLVAPLVRGEASLSYGRQIPHDGSDFFESFPRYFNYPEKSQVRSIKDIGTYGVYTFFSSDACAAYVNKALDKAGGFPPVLVGEDTYVTAVLLRKGHSIAYAADAVVKHSHRYTLWQEFTRYFDTGYARKQYGSLFEGSGGDNSRGRDFVRQMVSAVWNNKPSLLPYTLMQSGVKWLGYQLGKRSVQAPLWWKKKLSSQDFYWNSRVFKEQIGLQSRR